MKSITIILTFLFGVLLTLVVIYFGYFQNCKSNWEKQGYHTGYSTAQFDIYQKIKNDFGEIASTPDTKNFFSVKDIDVVMIKVDGIKTVRAVK